MTEAGSAAAKWIRTTNACSSPSGPLRMAPKSLPELSTRQECAYVTTNSTGVATAKVTATTDHYWRYEFRPTMTTSAVKAPGDFVDVR